MHYLEKEFKDFVAEIEDIVHTHYREKFPSLTIPTIGFDNGRKYWRIWTKSGSSRSVYGFVRKDDGAILRAATWKAPQTKTKSAVRGYITDPNPLDYCGPYSVKYVQ